PISRLRSQNDVSSFDLPNVLECVRLIRRILRIVGTGALALGLVLSAAWANLAIAYQLPGSSTLRIGACLALNVIALVALTGIVLLWARRWLSVLIYVVANAIFFAWSGSISASNDKNWATDVAHGITGAVEGDRLSVSNVRNFSWRSEADYTENWEQRTY